MIVLHLFSYFAKSLYETWKIILLTLKLRYASLVGASKRLNTINVNNIASTPINFNSGNLSTWIGLLLLKACKARDEGKSAKEVVELMENLVPKVRSQFVVETLDYLHKGGRCSGVVKFIGNILKLRIQIEVFEKSMRVAKKTIGAMKKALSLMVQDYVNNIDNVDDEFLFVTHSEADDSKNFIMNLLEPFKDKIKNLFITKAGCVISSHCGRGCIGILYIAK